MGIKIQSYFIDNKVVLYSHVRPIPMLTTSLQRDVHSTYCCYGCLLLVHLKYIKMSQKDQVIIEWMESTFCQQLQLQQSEVALGKHIICLHIQPEWQSKYILRV